MTTELDIDLSHWAGRPTVLQARQHNGFSWMLKDGAADNIFDPLDDPGIPFSVVGSLPDAAYWFNHHFPVTFQQLQQLESLYTGQQWTTLWLLESCPEIQPLLQRWPLLPWLLLEALRKGALQPGQLSPLISQGPLAILENCDLPADPDLLRLIWMLPTKELTPGVAELIRTEVVRNNAKTLTGYAHFGSHLLKGLAMLPWLADSRLLASYQSDWDWSDLRFYIGQINLAARQLGLESTEQLIRDTASLQELKELCGKLLRQLPEQQPDLETEMKIASAVLSALGDIASNTDFATKP